MEGNDESREGPEEGAKNPRDWNAAMGSSKIQCGDVSEIYPGTKDLRYSQQDSHRPE